VKPRVLFVSGTRYALPLQGAMARKWDALSEQVEVRVLARGEGDGDPRFSLALPGNGILWRVLLSRYVARELRAFQPDAVLAEGPVEAASCVRARLLAGSEVPVVTDIHGDWRTSTRLYGSRLRRLVSGKAERVATKGLRKADGVRTLSPFTSDLVRGVGVEPLAEFPAFIDLSGFEGPRAELPAQPRAAFVGVLERYKGLSTLMETWDLVRAELPDARLAMVGDGHAVAEVERFVARSEGSVTWAPRLANDEIAGFLDAATCLFLPSESEGLPRIIMESFCRGRPVVATRAGGVPDLVRDGENGFLLERGDAPGLAAALVRVLGDPEEARRLAAGAAASDGLWRATPEDFAARTRAVVDAVLARREP
jgi:glycosyltransferase involved in cell wall biosynthesis